MTTIFTEGSNDVGQLLTDAQLLSVQSGLNSVGGSIGSNADADLYKFTLTTETLFSATTVGKTAVDTQLFLFDSQGRGILANDDFNNQRLIFQAALPGTILQPGDYFLGISSYDNEPVSEGGLIFPNQGFSFVENPTGAGGDSPLSGWINVPIPANTANSAVTTGTYGIDITASPKVNLEFGQVQNQLTIEARLNGERINSVRGQQNGEVPNVYPFFIGALDSPDPLAPRNRQDFQDVTFLDQGEGIGIRDGEDGNSGAGKRLEKDEILGIFVEANMYQVRRAEISLDRILSTDGASFKVTAYFDNGTNFSVVDEAIFNLGSVPATGIQKLDFVSDGLFNALEISAADDDTQFTFRRVSYEAFAV